MVLASFGRLAQAPTANKQRQRVLQPGEWQYEYGRVASAHHKLVNVMSHVATTTPYALPHIA